MKKANRQTGFTIVELVVSLLIISIIVAISLPHLRAAGMRAQSTACESDQRLLRSALEEYYLTNHNYPPEPDGAGKIADLRTNGYLQTTPNCPAGGQFQITPAPDGSSVKVTCSVHGELGNQ